MKISIDLNSEVTSDYDISALLFFMKTGKKYWITADTTGGIGLHMFNGTLTKRVETHKGAIHSLDRFGNILIYGSDRGLGVLAAQNLEFKQFCETVMII